MANFLNAGHAENHHGQQPFECLYAPLEHYDKYEEFKDAVHIREVREDVVEQKANPSNVFEEDVMNEVVKDIWVVGRDTPFFDVPHAQVKNKIIVLNLHTKKVFPVDKEAFNERYEVVKAVQTTDTPPPKPKQAKPKEEAPKPKK